MKKNAVLPVLLILLILAGIACRRSADGSIPNTILGRWVLTDQQAASIGGPGVWSVASPSGQWMELQSSGQVSGTVFPGATGYQVLDSVTVKLTDATQTAGFRLFNYRVDTVARVLLFYIRPGNGGYCIEGCGGYKFGR
ncbi:MAG: hypothetical protein JWQ30_1077 [Sediminibacterium sp.]|nr:hypothetical protein [Sediminibacterium sp.]